jgi:hypothetical protein
MTITSPAHSSCEGQSPLHLPPAKVYAPRTAALRLTLQRRTFDRIATWEIGAKRSNRIPKDAHADRPVVRGEPLFDVFRPQDRSGYARVAGRSEAALAVGSTLTAFPPSSQYTPAERAGLFLKAGGEPQ